MTNVNKSLFGLSAAGLLLTIPALAGAEDYYRKTRGYRVEPASDPPPYVRNLSVTQFEQFRDVDWLDAGLDFRSRYEYRENDLRPETGVNPLTGAATQNPRPDPDNLWLLRTRAYLGVHDILDPLRFAVEYEDARSYNGLYERDNGTTNEFELIQGYAELYFKNLLGNNRPLSIRAGRQHLELLDRRLVGNNEFRNTTNNFEGFRVRFGKKRNDWDLDTFAFQPVQRLKYDFDRPDEKTWFYGGVLSLKHWSDVITIQPYFLGRKTNGDPNQAPSKDAPLVLDQDIYAPGLRVYGLFGNSGFDFDADINKQFGRFGVLRTKDLDGNSLGKSKQFDYRHDALAYSLELGYTFDHEWKPRASLYYGFGTGDKSPNSGSVTSGVNNRFDSFYGFNQPWSRNDYFSWDNIRTPKARLELTPYKDVRLDMGFGAYWLESETEAWNRTGLRDRGGRSGSYLGHEFDIRLRHHLNPYLDWSLSYGRFTPGNFTEDAPFSPTATDAITKVQRGFTEDPSNFFYFEVAVNAFGDGNIH
ncbi:MAG TPA: alginate export family protein [Methylococcaceae bacterium]|nr:alginate export family protein [Methylococcaceae bacterium]